MIRGTTPILTFTIRNPDIDLTSAHNVYVSFVQERAKPRANLEIVKMEDDLEINGRTVKVWLTQKESLELCETTSVKVQINWTYYDLDGVTLRRGATRTRSIHIGEQLLKRVIE